MSSQTIPAKPPASTGLIAQAVEEGYRAAIADIRREAQCQGRLHDMAFCLGLASALERKLEWSRSRKK